MLVKYLAMMANHLRSFRMKHTKIIVIAITQLLISQSVFAMGSRRPKSSTPKPTATPTSTPTVTPSPIVYGNYTEEIMAIAKNSSCNSYSFKNRGRAPAGYIEGMALTFARSLCRAKKVESKPNGLVEILTSPNSHRDSSDALTHYQSNFEQLSMSLANVGIEPLRAVYVLGIGLGMRESSGNYCEGYDKAAGGNRSSSAAEAGLFQTSYDSIKFSPELTNLYTEYKNSNASRCYLDVFKIGAGCSNTSYLGTGDGLEFQKFTRACPAFAAEYAMTMLRIARSHYGPINRREAEVLTQCNEMLLSVQELINKDSQGVCGEVY